jgi:hypothetical protein
MPITFDQEIVLTASEYTPEVGEVVIFSVNVKKDTYKYDWDLGTDVDISNDETTVSYTYTEVGNYSPYVNVTDAKGNPVGSGICDIEVKEIAEATKTIGHDLTGDWSMSDTYTGSEFEGEMTRENYSYDIEIISDTELIINDGWDSKATYTYDGTNFQIQGRLEMVLDDGSIYVLTTEIVAQFVNEEKTKWTGTLYSHATNTDGMDISSTHVGSAVKE